MRHLLLLLWGEIVGHVVEYGEEIVAMADFIVRAVRLSAAPPAFAIYIKQTLDALGQIASFRAQFLCSGIVSFAIEQSSNKAHAGDIARVHSRDFVQIGA